MAEHTPQEASRPTAWTPIPDPTVLTTQATDAAKDQLRRELQAVQQLLEVRLVGLERMQHLLQAQVDRLPDAWKQLLAQERELTSQQLATLAEGFTSVQKQLHERDTRFDESARSAKAQRTSLKEAILKAERMVEKQIKTLARTQEKTMDSFSGQIADIKSRLERLEGAQLGAATMQERARGAQHNVLSLLAVVVAVGGVLTMIILSLIKH